LQAHRKFHDFGFLKRRIRHFHYPQ
jgi:hypothetical protein